MGKLETPGLKYAPLAMAPGLQIEDTCVSAKEVKDE